MNRTFFSVELPWEKWAIFLFLSYIKEHFLDYMQAVFIQQDKKHYPTQFRQLNSLPLGHAVSLCLMVSVKEKLTKGVELK